MVACAKTYLLTSCASAPPLRSAPPPWRSSAPTHGVTLRHASRTPPASPAPPLPPRTTCSWSASAGPVSPGSCATGVQRCADSHCGAAALCRPLSHSPTGPRHSCLCRAGYTGAHCETDVNECASNPCRNRALCRDEPNGYSCFCVPGFQGRHCEIDVNECAVRPCRNGATCLNRVGRFFCLCKAGYTGTRCELQVDECQSDPCLNGGSCHDYVNGFSCACPPGFQGDFCEVDIDECNSQPCHNGVPCADWVNGYSCDCTESGFTGLNCDIPIPPCVSQPCLNGAPCQESQGNYTCDCWPGAFCEEDVDECDLNPCQNRGLCENYPGGYTCHCSRQSQDGRLYGGQNCTVALLGCEDHMCRNGATCLPFLVNGEHGHHCACPAGFAGSECQASTTFSFETGGHLFLESPATDPEASWNVTLSFRTVLADVALLQRRAGELVFQLELAGGRPCLRGLAGGRPGPALEVPRVASDGEWHAVEAAGRGGALAIRLLDASCGEECERTATESGWPGVGSGLGAEPEPAFHTVFIGGFGEDGGKTHSASSPRPPFVGCLRDVRVDSRLVVPGDWLKGTAVNTTPGCSDRDRCEDSPCQNRGRCISQWMSYQCECYRPFEGPDCSEEHVPARFSSEGLVSYGLFTMGEASGEGVDITMFVRTRNQGALLLVLANGTSQYLQLWLEEGRVTARAHDFETLRGQDTVSDGHFHLLGLRIQGNRMTLSQSARVQGVVPVRSVWVQPGDLVYVGGLPDTHASASFGGYLKGCVQDLRLGARRLQFYPLGGVAVNSYGPTQLVSVTRGCTSDDTCTLNPCLNGGACYSMWDDFTCSCPPSTAGRRCEEVMWCELSPCPPTTAACQPLAHGFECISNATFPEDGEAVSYASDGEITRSLTNVSFSIRTRRRNAPVLRAQKGSEFLAVSLRDSRLHLELRSGGRSLGVSVGSRVAVSDGQWHSVTLSMVTPGSETSRWAVAVDERGEPSVSRVATGNLDFLKEGAELLLGGVGHPGGEVLAGCLGTVEIGGIALPYLRDSELRLPRPQQERFVRTSADTPALGCWRSPVCAPDPCLNGGWCQDLMDLSRCVCPAGWAGPRCELSTDPCASSPCVHGNCSGRALGYACACEPGYAGPTCQSREEEDPCTSHRCAWGATCLRGYATYSCLCPPDRTGPLCHEKYKQVSWYVENYLKPILPEAVCGGDHWNYTCYNGGNCTRLSSRWTCDCMEGFTGQWCETDVDECTPDPCLNGGYCINMIDEFHCVCERNFAGKFCELRLPADGLGSVVLLSVSLASVALLLALSLATAALVSAMKRRATHGTYSPSRREKEGPRVEMWSIAQTPPTERLI
ncbi:hypothetical protein AAFF_G00103910 [Aldrovandia affinis]|uniref:Protein crumbs homolog 1 n=1 Tax=Aldrovandia affinis TaxID=143900 RepID=A0AAD7RWS2_9TELE|nr:hypothetical protein AAFF_G00103910 [Aldrovandia affinis]